MSTRPLACIVSAISILSLLALTACDTDHAKARLVAQAGAASLDAPGQLLTAVTLRNDGDAAALDVKVTSASITGATFSGPGSLPVVLGAIPRDKTAILTVNFAEPTAAADTDYTLDIAGNFREDGHVHKFEVKEVLRTPPASPGTRVAHSGTTIVHPANGGPYPPQKPHFGGEINEPGLGRPVPTGPLRPLTISKASLVQPAVASGGTASAHFPTNAPVGIASSTVAEPSGASAGGVVFETANWYAAYSTTGGSSWTQLSPSTIFPNAVDSGFCCDQVVQYVPSIDRFIWVMQYGPTTPAPNPNPKKLPSLGPGLYRIAFAKPADLKNGVANPWSYFDITSQTVLGTTSSPWFDYPDVSYGNQFLYLAADNVNGGGHVVVRISLSDIAAAGTIHFSWTTPSDSAVAWGGHVSQNTGDQVFWAGHNSNSSIRVFNWPESSGSYSWRDIAIGSWPQTGLSSLTPDLQNWPSFGFPGNAVTALARTTGARDQKRSLLYLGWSGGIGNGFTQPQVDWIALDINNNFALVSQQQVWNSTYAYAYPAFAVNTNNELGMSLEWGGGGNYENHVAGFWGDYVVYQTTNSSVGTGRFGDYVTIRQNTADPTKFDVFGYGLNQSTPPGTPVSDVHYMVMGR